LLQFGSVLGQAFELHDQHLMRPLLQHLPNLLAIQLAELLTRRYLPVITHEDLSVGF
jgi:hypothetical protein